VTQLEWQKQTVTGLVLTFRSQWNIDGSTQHRFDFFRRVACTTFCHFDSRQLSCRHLAAQTLRSPHRHVTFGRHQFLHDVIPWPITAAARDDDDAATPARWWKNRSCGDMLRQLTGVRRSAATIRVKSVLLSTVTARPQSTSRSFESRVICRSVYPITTRVIAELNGSAEERSKPGISLGAHCFCCMRPSLTLLVIPLSKIDASCLRTIVSRGEAIIPPTHEPLPMVSGRRRRWMR
jgi:hypothetical protein